MTTKTHYQQEGTNLVKRPACNPSAYESYNWSLTTKWKEVTCKNCINLLNNVEINRTIN